MRTRTDAGAARRRACDEAAILRLARHRQLDGAARRLGGSRRRRADGGPRLASSRRSRCATAWRSDNFKIPPTDIRVLPGDVGGSFGMKSGVHQEFVLVAWAARKLDRPVRWIADRTEGFLTDEQAREMRIIAELGSGCGRQDSPR